MNKVFTDILIFLKGKEFSSADGKIHLNDTSLVRYFDEYARYLIELSEKKGSVMLREVKKAGFSSSLLSFLKLLRPVKSSFEILTEQERIEILLAILSAEGWGIFELNAYGKKTKAHIKVRQSFEAKYISEKKEANSHCSFITGFIEAVWFLAHCTETETLFEEKIDLIEKHISETPVAFEKTCSKEGAQFCSFEINKIR
ncbi:MAG: hypothetical protein OEZ13_13435 [Spirochaetia bacterium]|nr:hypothetical protein [Spirochaetia bacterium]